MTTNLSVTLGLIESAAFAKMIQNSHPQSLRVHFSEPSSYAIACAWCDLPSLRENELTKILT